MKLGIKLATVLKKSLIENASMTKQKYMNIKKISNDYEATDFHDEGNPKIGSNYACLIV